MVLRDRAIATFFIAAALLSGLVLAFTSDEGKDLSYAHWRERIIRLSLHKQAAFWSGLVFLIAYAVRGFRMRGTKILLLDFHCFNVPKSWKSSRDQFIAGLKNGKGLPEEAVEYCQQILDVSGIGNATGMPERAPLDLLLNMLGVTREGPIKQTLHEQLNETNSILFDVAEQAMHKAGVTPAEVNIVIASSSAFAPTPSLAAMLVNKFKLDSRVLTYNLSGMGCSSSMAAVDLAKHMLRALPDCVVLVVNHENVTANWYPGTETRLMLQNCTFRTGGAAAILSNRPGDRRRAKYELVDSYRTHLGGQSDAFRSMVAQQDDAFMHGMCVEKNVLAVTGRAIKANLSGLAPRVLPFSELLWCAIDKTYTPNFRRSFQHFLLHTASRHALADLERNLRLSRKQLDPSRDALYRFGNTACASTWYILAGIEHGQGVRAGDLVLQLAYGSGFKAGSAVWKARRNIKQSHSCWA